MGLEYTLVGRDENMFGIRELLTEELAGKNGDVDAYLRDLDTNIEENPHDPISYVKKSILLSRGEKRGIALATVEEGLSLCDDTYLLHHMRAMIYESTGKRQEAISDLKKAVALEPVAIESLISLATILHRDKQYDESLKQWDEALRYDSDTPEIWNGKAKAEFEMGQYDRALKHEQAAIFCDPTNSSAYVNKARMLFEMQRPDDALAVFNEMREGGIKPDEFVPQMKKIGIAYHAKGNTREAARLFEKAREIDPNNVDTYLGLIALYKSANQRGRIDATCQGLVEATERIRNISSIELVGEMLVGMGEMQYAWSIAGVLYRKTGNSKYRSMQDGLSVFVSKKDVSSLQSKQVGRNDPCSCGSGQKYKKCCGK